MAWRLLDQAGIVILTGKTNHLWQQQRYYVLNFPPLNLPAID
jgi:hypothetical protein